MLPSYLQEAALHARLAADPTDPSTLWAVNHNCLSSSKDKGETWSACSAAIPKGKSLSR